MKPPLTSFQKKLCNALQQGLPLCSQPFAQIAKALGSTEPEVLRQTRALAEAGVIRRVSAVINHRALGMSGTLVTAHVPPEKLAEVTDAVNRLPGVSHNYLRRHAYNIWFTLQEKTPAQMQRTLCGLEQQTGIRFHSLPVTRVFKLDVRFDAEAEEDVLVQDVPRVPGTETVALRPDHERMIMELQGGLHVTSRPFEALRAEAWSEADVLRLLAELQELGVIRRVAAIVNHRKLGFTANVMFAAEVPETIVVEAGRRLARFRAVSHCYERETFRGWPYNLFAMMHGRSMDQIQSTVEKFTEPGDVRSYALLATEAELKKQPVRHKLL